MTRVNTPAGVWCGYVPPRDSKPGVIEMLYATRESRTLMGSLLGVAGLHSLEAYGALPVGSHNLSCHSFPIQQRLAFILGQIPADAVANTENWVSSINYLARWDESFQTSLGEAVPLPQLARGREFLLEILSSEVALTPTPEWAIAKDKEYAKQRRINGQVLDNLERQYGSSITRAFITS